MTIHNYLTRLKAARTQEDVDMLVKSAAATLNPHDLGRFLGKVKDRRAQLPSRYGTEASL